MTNVPKTMKAMVLTDHGSMERYEWRMDWPVPIPGDDEVLIRIRACGLNNTDVNTRIGWYSKAVTGATDGVAEGVAGTDAASWGGKAIEFPRIQGADAVGIVVAAGDKADPELLGKRVMVDGWLRDWNDPCNLERAGYFGSEADGGFAEFAKIHWRNVRAVTSDLSDAELATFSCSYSTAEGMLSRAGVTADDTVLVPGASGGVGGALIQLSKRRGARVVALASESKHEEVAKLGPDMVLPRSPENLDAELGSEKVTVAADVVGGPIWPQIIGAIQRGGRYVCSGAIAGPVVPFDLRTLYLRDLTFFGSTVVPPDVLPNIVGYIERGEVKPVVAAIYPLSELREAQQAFLDKSKAGNIVVVA
ncbi:MAG: alcohol dehydrogenase family protein [Albidovulum sp.]|nr:alcohol dehydrogenase family protein [Albidovulum sp.]